MSAWVAYALGFASPIVLTWLLFLWDGAVERERNNIIPSLREYIRKLEAERGASLTRAEIQALDACVVLASPGTVTHASAKGAVAKLRGEP